MKTFSAKPLEVKRKWIIFDASDQVLGRLSAQIASYLRGKHKAIYTPHVDTGDYIIVVNAKHVRVTGNKVTQKVYHRHTGYPGGLRSRTFREQMDRDPTRVIEEAVRGMLPRGPLGYAMFRKLKVYAGQDHPHAAQQPECFKS